MGTINVLSSKIYNRIAAGEVVERPYSVVKELVENSIDAKAKNITIEILGGGISSIRVFDDGTGIEKDQLKKALLPHATSKISAIDDLDNILTLGFRGEALASIASVSKTTITSKPKNQEVGATINCEGGVMCEPTDCASPDGTEILVKNLFYNTPAREKFLKTERGEESDITGMVSKFILGNPDIAFKYVADGKTVFQSFGDGVESAMTAVYGNSVINDCFYINTEKNGIKISGYIGKHNFFKSNRTYQSVFLNGRYIVNQTIASAITNAYASYMMKRQYPFYVLSIELPPKTVDVNVHPNKTDVRFSDNRIVYGAVYSVVSKVLDGTGEALNIIVENKENASVLPQDYVTHKQSEFEKPKFDFIKNSDKFSDFCFANNSGAKSLNYNEDIKLSKIEKKENTVDIFAENKAYLESLERQRKLKAEEVSQYSVVIEKDLRYVGQVLNTYLIFDDGTDMFVVDQHAAHERILFDAFNETVKNGNIDVQPLLIPYVENVNASEYEFLTSKADVFGEMGIDLSDFGDNSIKISALPTSLSDMNVHEFLSEILSDLDEFKSISVADLLKEKIAQKACKSAIKSGDSVSNVDAEIIAEKIKSDLGLKCPHGRPVVVKITRTEMDKWFKRIL